MDLTTAYPRSAKERLAGIDSLARTIDKTHAYNAGSLGEYDYDCPHDKPLFEFLGTNGDEFAAKVKELKTDDAIVAWLKQGELGSKTPGQIDAFNADREAWHPAPGSSSEEFFNQLRAKIAPGRTDVTTWFDLLDLDEKRPVPVATPA